MESQLEELIHRFAKEGHAGLQNKIAITWIRYDKPNPDQLSGKGASWASEKMIYPASVIKLFYAIALEAWLQEDIFQEGIEMRNALNKMIQDSSNDATSLIVDLLTGTTSGPSLSGEAWSKWQIQRQLINEWLQSLKWPELDGINCCQKTWNDEPFGRERDFYGLGNNNRNSLSTSATARMLEAIMTQSIISPPACKRIKRSLSRSLDIVHRKANPDNQIDGFIGEGLPIGTLLWNKAGWMSEVRHDAAWFQQPKGNPTLLIIFCQGRELSKDQFLLPAIANELSRLNQSKEQQ